jgi:predicted RNA-binding Zn-ribbon protein involved in translation (DUF1610 family)
MPILTNLTGVGYPSRFSHIANLVRIFFKIYVQHIRTNGYYVLFFIAIVALNTRCYRFDTDEFRVFVIFQTKMQKSCFYNVKARFIVSLSNDSISTKLSDNSEIAKFSCRECGYRDIDIIYKYGYYFKCKKCGKIMPIIKIGCLSCGQQLKLHKDRNKLYFQCKTCNTSKLFVVNS